MKKINIRVDQDDLVLLDQLADSAQLSRSELIRNSVLTTSNGRRITPVQYQELISAAYRRTNLPRQQVQQLVDFVFVELMAHRD